MDTKEYNKRPPDVQKAMHEDFKRFIPNLSVVGTYVIGETANDENLFKRVSNVGDHRVDIQNVAMGIPRGTVEAWCRMNDIEVVYPEYPEFTKMAYFRPKNDTESFITRMRWL
jgi:hypothetical protein